MSGLAALAPATKPASNFLMRSISTPPMKPILPVLVFSAAAAPTRNEPCSSANDQRRPRSASVDDRVDRSAKLVSGLAVGDAAVMASPHRKPTPMMSWLPSSTSQLQALGAVAVARRASTRCRRRRTRPGLVEAGGGGVVERLVATAGDVVQQADLRVLDGRGQAALGSGRVRAALGRRGGVAATLGRCCRFTRRGGRRRAASSRGARPGVVVIAARRSHQAERGDESHRKQSLAPDHCLPLLGNVCFTNRGRPVHEFPPTIAP